MLPTRHNILIYTKIRKLFLQSKRWCGCFQRGHSRTERSLRPGSAVAKCQSPNAECIGEGERLLSLRHSQDDQDSLFAADGDSAQPQGSHLRRVHTQGAPGQVAARRPRRQQVCHAQAVSHDQEAAEREAPGGQRPPQDPVPRVRHSVRRHPHAWHTPAQIAPTQWPAIDLLALKSLN